MSYKTRATTVGNTPVDITKVRQNFNQMPSYIRATLRNAVPLNGETPEKGDVGGVETVNQYKLQRLSDVLSNNINAVTDLRAITPYVDKAELIWDTILLYPNGKQDKILTYSTIPSKLKNVALHAELLKVWEEYFTNDYKIEDDLSKMIKDILWNTGSYVLFNLSRPGLDYLINGSEVDPKTNLQNEPLDAKAREGAEAFAEYQRQYHEAETAKAMGEFNKSFVNDPTTNKVKVRNLGLFIKNPNKKAAPSTVNGLERLLRDPGSVSEDEYRLFDEEFDPLNEIDITITDNPACLFLPRFHEKRRVEQLGNVVGTENINMMVERALKKDKDRDPIGPNDTDKKQKKAAPSDATTQNLDSHQVAEIARELYPARNIRSQSMQFVKSIDTLSIAPYGRGLVFHIPSEAVLPIHRNGVRRGNPDVIVLMDRDTGEFLKTTIDPEFYQSKSATRNGLANKNKTGSENAIISSLRTVQSGKPCDFDMREFADISRANLIRQFTSAIISDKADSVSITLDEEVNKIFLSRMFAKQGVRCLYIPGEAITYMALKYSDLGTGQSLTQLAKMHIARLAAFDVADTLANLEAAQPHTLMNITHGKEDGDPENSAAIARAAFYDNNPGLHSLISTAQLSVPSIVESMRNSSLTIKVNAGDNPLVAVPEIDMQHMEKNHFKPVDDTSRQKVMNDIANYFHTPRSWLDVSDDSNNFKIEAITEHDMVVNQAANWQDTLADFLVDFMRKHARVNEPLLNSLVEVIVDNKKLWKPEGTKVTIPGDEGQVVNMLLADFFSSVKVSFPIPSSIESTDKLKNQLEAIDTLVSKWMDIASSSAILTDIASGLGFTDGKASGEAILKHVKAYFYSEAFKRYNVPMPFDDIVNDGKSGGIASLVHGIIHQQANSQEFFVQYMTEKLKADKAFQKSHKAILDKLKADIAETNGEGTDGLGEETDDQLGGQEPGTEDESSGLNVEEPPPLEPGEEEEEEEPPEGESKPDESTEDVDAPVDGKSAGSSDPTSPDYNPWKGGK